MKKLLDELISKGFRIIPEKKSTLIYFDNKNIGQLKNNRFYTFRNQRDRFMIYEGFGFNKSLIESLDRHGIDNVVVKWNDVVFKTTPKIIKTKGTTYKHTNYEEQFILNDKNMEVFK